MKFRTINRSFWPRFTSLSALASALTSKGSSFEHAWEFVTPDGLRVAVESWVGSAVEFLSPQSRIDGGWGVVASVDSASEVTLVAGHTLIDCRARIWDITGSVHLDAGGVEAHVDGNTCIIPSTSGMAAGDIVYSDRPDFTSYSAASAFLTAVGSSFDCVVRVVNSTGPSVIMRLAWVDGVVRVIGPIRLDRVSTSSWSSVVAAGAGTIQVALATWTRSSGTIRAWDRTAGTELGDAVYTRAAAILTVDAAFALLVANALGLGHVVDVWDTATELQVGGNTRAIQLEALSTARFSHGLISAHAASGDVGISCGAPAQHIVTSDTMTLGGAAADCWMAGWRGGGGTYAYCGLYRSGADAKAALVRSAGAVVVSALNVTIANCTGWRGLFGYASGLGAGSVGIVETSGSVAITSAVGCALTAPKSTQLWIHGVNSTGRITQIRAIY